MKITTKAEYQMTEEGLELISEESYEYDGPISECKGGDSGGTQTTVQKTSPWEGVQPHLLKVYEEAQRQYNQPMEFFGGQTYADMNPTQTQGLQSQLNYAQGMMGDINATRQAQMNALNAPDVANNPYIGGVADTITQRMNRNFQENLLPAISGGAIQAGQPGGSRQGVAQGVAARGTQEALGGALSDLYGNAYSQGLDAQGRALALAPQTAQLGMLPGQSMYNIGQIQRAEDQRPITEAMARHEFAQNEPWERLAKYSGLLGTGLGYGTTSTTGPNMSGGGSSPMAGAAAGASMGTAVMPGWGTAIGGILGYLGSR
jgi:hypothetical protein